MQISCEIYLHFYCYLNEFGIILAVTLSRTIKSKADMTYEEFIKIITDLVAKDDEIIFRQKELERDLREGKRNTIADEMIGLCNSGINNACEVVYVCRKYLQENKHLA